MVSFSFIFDVCVISTITFDRQNPATISCTRSLQSILVAPSAMLRCPRLTLVVWAKCAEASAVHRYRSTNPSERRCFVFCLLQVGPSTSACSWRHFVLLCFHDWSMVEHLLEPGK